MSIPVVILIFLPLLGATAFAFHRAAHLKKTLTELRRRNYELQETLRSQGELTKEIAHELKNPISAIVCASDTLELLLGDQLDDLHRRTLHHIRDYGSHVLTLMHDFIDVSRGISGQLTSNKTHHYMKDMIAAVVGLLEPSAGTRSISINVLHENEDAALFADSKHVKQILFNLLHNAIKFTPEGGEVVIQSYIDLTKLDSPLVKIRICDSGPGLSEKDILAIRSPIKGLRRSASGPELGSGLGLALTKTLLDLEDCSLEIETELTIGTALTIEVPRGILSPIQESSAVSSCDRNQFPLEGKEFLIVEGQNNNQEVLALLIQALGGTVDRVGLAIDAVEAIHGKTYSAILVDDDADETCGVELAKTLYRERDSEETKIILSHSGDASETTLGIREIDGVLEKPFDREALMESLLGSRVQ